MKIGVTGAGGYVGSGLCYYLIKKGHDVVMIDNFYKSQVKKILDQDILWVDVRDKNDLDRVFRDCELIIHLAAISGVAECDSMAEKAYDVNVVGTANVCWICRKYGVDLIFPSSMAVVGDPTELPVKGNHRRNPLNMYGFTKWVGEKLIETFSHNSFNALIFVKSNLYGEYSIENKKISKNTVINIFVNRAKAGKPLTVHKPGTQSRDFIHVLDVIEAYIKAVENFPLGLNVVTLASGECLSVLDIAKIVQKYTGCKIELVENPRSKETLVEKFLVDTSEIKELIGFEAKRTVEGEIRKLLGANS